MLERVALLEFGVLGIQPSRLSPSETKLGLPGCSKVAPSLVSAVWGPYRPEGEGASLGHELSCRKGAFGEEAGCTVPKGSLMVPQHLQTLPGNQVPCRQTGGGGEAGKC